jgi:hypothetical protein
MPDVSPSERQFRVVYEWRTLDFAFRNEQERSAAIFRGEYVPRNVIFSAIKPYANRLYMSIPRMLPGSPATLGYIVAPDNNGRTDPEIEPYPNWQMNEIGNCSALQFVQGKHSQTFCSLSQPKQIEKLLKQVSRLMLAEFSG